MADAQALRTAEAFPLQAVSPARPRRQVRRLGLQGSEFTWAVAFVIPYVGVFLAFVAYPVVYGLWLGSDPALYAELMSEPIYQRTVVNTTLYLVIGVNLKMFGALLLSGLFLRRGWWVKGLLIIYVLPWAVPALPSFMSIHWMLNGQWGLLNNVLWNVFGVDGPGWLDVALAGAGLCDHVPYLEMDAVLDRDPAGGADGDPAGAVRGSRDGRRHRPQALHLRYLPAACQSLSRLHPALDAVHPW